MSSLLEALVFIGDALDVVEVVSRLLGASLESPMTPIPRRAWWLPDSTAVGEASRCRTAERT